MTWIKPLKKFSQNFLVNEVMQKKICDALHASSKDYIVEIGPGTGALSQHLAQKDCLSFCMLEYDIRCVQHLTETLLSTTSARLFHDNVLTFKWETLEGHPLCIIGCLPYHITSPILLLLLNIPFWKEAVFVIQKEVGQRVTALPHTKAYGSLSVLLQSLCFTEYLFDIEADAFFPAPSVTSCAIKLKPRPNPPAPPALDKLQKLTSICFQKRRKQLKTILRSEPHGAKALLELNIDPLLRPENLSPQEFLALAEKIF